MALGLLGSAALLVGLAAVWAAHDAWKRYLVALDRTAGLKALEAALVARIAKLEANQAAHTRALGAKAIHAVRQAAE